MRLSELAEYAGLTFEDEGDAGTDVCGASSYSGSVNANDVFFAIAGMRTDGHDYIAEAVRRGASAVVVDKKRVNEFKDIGVALLGAENTREAYAYAADAIFGYPSKRIRCIAVTGTNGKTSIAYMLCAMLDKAGIDHGLIGTAGCFFNGERLNVKSENELANLTTPDPYQLYSVLSELVKKKASVAVMETTSHASVLKKLASLHFEYAIFSNLSPEHLDIHGNMDNYFSAKLDILRKAESVILNYDDAYASRITKALHGVRIVSASTVSDRADCYAENVRMFGTEGIDYTLYLKGKRSDIKMHLTGAFNVSNSLLAAACASEMGIPNACIRSALGGFLGVPGRMQKISRGYGVPFSVFVDYAHTPDALEKVLSAFKDVREKNGRLVLLFGCGGDRDKTKRSVMGRIASQMADFVVVTSDNSRSERPSDIINDIISGFPEGFDRYTVIESRREAIKHTISNALSGDTILLAGKGHEKYEIDSSGKHPFDEIVIVEECCLNYKREHSGE